MDDIMRSFGEGLGLLVAAVQIGAFFLLPLWLLLARGRFDRDRIINSVECQGWEVLSIAHAPRFFDHFSRRSGRRYRVVYRTGTGEIVAAECWTSLFSGNEWISTMPFALSDSGGWGTLRSSRGSEPWEVARRDRIQKIRAMLP